MEPNRLALILIVAWVVAVLLSFIHPYYASPAGGEIVMGVNLIAIWLGWQVGALMFAVALLIVRLTRGEEMWIPLRFLSFAPIGATVLAGGALLFKFVGAV